MKLRVPMPRWFTAYGTRFMPFADAASPELPMARLLRLSLFQVVIGMVTALLVGTLNRVMIVELMLPAMVPGLFVKTASRTVVQLDAEMRGRKPTPEAEEFAYVI